MTTLSDTRERLLDVAERLFAERGISDASLRQITAEAEANLAAVHYHFGSKLELVRAVYGRRLEPMNRERLERLQAVLDAAGDGCPDLRGVLEAFLAPALKLGESEGRSFFVLVARGHAVPDPEVQRIITDQFEDIAEHFGKALTRTLPGVPMTELFWRMHFVVGAMCHTVLNTPLLTLISKGLCTADDEQAVLDRLVDFSMAGLTALQDGEGGEPS